MNVSASKTPLGGGRPRGRRYQPYLPLYRMHPHHIASREVGIHYLGQRYIALHPHVVRLGYLHVSSSKTGIETELSVSRNPQKHHYFFHNVVKDLSPGVALHEKRRPAGRRKVTEFIVSATCGRNKNKSDKVNTTPPTVI